MMLGSANGQPANGSRGGGGAEAVMAEVVALRAILLNVLFKQANGERLTTEEMQKLINRADSDKLTKARERLEPVPFGYKAGDRASNSRFNDPSVRVCEPRKIALTGGEQ